MYHADAAPALTTPVLAAAQARLPRRRPIGKGGGGIENPASNYVAEAPRRRAGAPPGNRNGWKHGWRSAPVRARDAVIAKFLKDTRKLCREIDDMVRARKDRATLEAHILAHIPSSPRAAPAAEFAAYDPRTTCLFDTTLRDGAQTQEVDLSVEDKR
jgi:hypothetical protein